MLTGQKIANLRIQANMTQEQLAEKLFVTREMISQWEREICKPDYRIVIKIAKIFQVNPDEILVKNDAIMNELSGYIPNNFNEKSDTFMKLLNTFLSTLNKRDRSIFIRRYYFMEDNSVIASNYDIKENNVRTVLMRTRKKLRKFLEEVGNE